MALKLVEKPMYRIIFGPDGPIPLIDTQMIFQEDITEFFRAHNLLFESIMRGEKSDYGSRSVIPESIEGRHVESGTAEIDRQSDVRSFDIAYENPVTHKMEVMHAKTETISTNIKNPIQKALKTGSTYAVYKFITTPIYIERIDPYIWEQAMKKIEITSPKPFGGGVAIPIIKVVQANKKIKAEKKAEVVRTSLIEVKRRKRIVRKKIDKQIVVLEMAVKALRKKKPLPKIIEKLPRRIRALLLVKLRNKKKVDNEIVEMMLLDDIKFLEALKIKLGKMGLKDFIRLATALKKLVQKEK